jgi:hypothetical protein
VTGDRDAPWWRSDGDHLAGDEDPVALHLAARNGEATDPGGHREDRADGRADARADARDRDRPDGDTGHVPGPDCDICPICLGIAHVRESHPEVADHLVDAVRHLTLAVRSLMDDVGSGRQGAADDPEHTDARRGRTGARRPPAHRSRPGGAGGAGFVSIPLDDLGGPQ